MTTVLLWLILSTAPPAPEGALCSPQSPDFDQVAYGVAKCRRRVTMVVRKAVFARSGIPWQMRGLYEVDHVLPLCLGGSNELENLAPQPWRSAKRKDVLENRLCRQLREGRISQPDAVAQMREWEKAR